MQAERTRVDIVQCAKTYADGTRGLLPTSLSVEPGEALALLGPSGCGNHLASFSLSSSLRAMGPAGRRYPD